jgi:CRISPR-associated protein (TIGR02584 family)
MKQQNYKEKILVCVTGLSPQVVTETLYSLVCLKKPAFVPTQIHLITTREGAEHIQLTLLDPNQGKFFEFCQDYDIPVDAIKFNASTVHVLQNNNNESMQDIRSDNDNELMANSMIRLIQQLTSIDDSILHVSIAGGRKTMGFYLGYAISLFGREQDRLSHVLVSEEFENNHEFYYPPPQPKIMFTRQNKPVKTDQAKISLADIPFVRMRNGIPQSLLQGKTSFIETVNEIQKTFLPIKLIINRHCEIIVAEKIIKMKPIEQAFYLWMIWRKLKNRPNIRYTEVDVEEFLTIYRQLPVITTGNVERVEKSLNDGMSKEYFEQKQSKANTALKAKLGQQAEPYLIKSSGSRPETRFGVRLGIELIEWENMN